MANGLYKIKMSVGDDIEAGVVFHKDGKIFGGNDVYYYTGEFEKNDGSGVIYTGSLSPDNPSRNHPIRFSGKFDGKTLKGTANEEFPLGGPGSLWFEMTLISEA